MPQVPPRCQLVPQPSDQTAFQVDGADVLRWNSSKQARRPFFWPLIGPAGVPLTRIGHPGAPDHDHHLSVWFAHEKVNGVNFWSDRGTGLIRQKQWLCYEDGDEHAAMAVRLSWRDGDRELLEHDLVAIVRPLPQQEFMLELQSTFKSIEDSATFGQSNFGVFAVRVAKSISAHFGGGKLTNSEGSEDETNLFGQSASWVDYSGPVARRDGKPIWNGITYFDHPANPGYPAHWHVREDGWMGASLTRLEALTISKDSPLTVRYLLHAHRNSLRHEDATTVALAFATSPVWQVEKSSRKHQHYHLTQF